MATTIGEIAGGVERPMSLASLEYIQSENERLIKDPMRCLDPREINIRMKYKYCPKMILIDTPGLSAAPRQACGQPEPNSHQRALQTNAQEAEHSVTQKIRCPDYIFISMEVLLKSGQHPLFIPFQQPSSQIPLFQSSPYFQISQLLSSQTSQKAPSKPSQKLFTSSSQTPSYMPRLESSSTPISNLSLGISRMSCYLVTKTPLVQQLYLSLLLPLA